MPLKLFVGAMARLWLDNINIRVRNNNV